MNKNNFWNNSEGTWVVLSENDNFFRAVETAFNFGTEKTLMNFNHDGSAFFIREETFCIRVSSKWGEVGNCCWNLDRDIRQEFIVAKIEYDKLLSKS
jgi:hypothetical protein